MSSVGIVVELKFAYIALNDGFIAVVILDGVLWIFMK